MRAILLFGSLLLLALSSTSAVELLMRKEYKPVGNLSEEEARTGRSVPGMFISVSPDGADWGTGIRGNTNYIIVKLPGITNIAFFRKFVTEDYDDQGNLYRYRRWKWPTTNLTTLQRRILTNETITIRATGGDLTWSVFSTNLFDLRYGTNAAATTPQ